MVLLLVNAGMIDEYKPKYTFLYSDPIVSCQSAAALAAKSRKVSECSPGFHPTELEQSGRVTEPRKQGCKNKY